MIATASLWRGVVQILGTRWTSRRRHKAIKTTGRRIPNEAPGPPRALPLILGLVVLLPLAFFPWTLDPFVLPKQIVLVLSAVTALLVMSLRGVRIPSSIFARAALLGLVLAEVLAFAASADRLGSILGNYAYRFGLASHLALIVLWLASFTSVRSISALDRLFSVALVAAVAVCGYDLIQGIGGDPFYWAGRWSQAFSTLGNPNDLAGYLVLSVAFLAGTPIWWKSRPRWFAPGFLILVAVSVLFTESRSGFVGLFVAMGALPVLAYFAAWPRPAMRTLSIGLGAGAVAVVLLGLVSGRATVLADRFSQNFDDGTVELGPRPDIWKGSLAVYQEHRLFGVGQDGLFVSFNRERPADLGEPFSVPSATGIDPMVGSPHSVPFEVLVTIGPLGAIATLMLLGLAARAYWRSLLKAEDPTYPYLGAGIVGYSVVAVVNPASLAVLAILAVVAGAVVGMDEGDSGSALRRLRPRLGVVAGSLAGAALILLSAGASVLAIADRAAYHSAQASANGNYATAGASAADAARLAPVESAYRRMEIQTLYQLARVNKDRELAGTALVKQREFLSDFAGLSVDFLTLAQLLLLLQQPGVDTALRQASAASPHGVDTANSVATISAEMDTPVQYPNH